MNSNTNHGEQVDKIPDVILDMTDDDTKPERAPASRALEPSFDESRQISESRYDSITDFDRLLDTPYLNVEMAKYRLPTDLRGIATTAINFVRDLQEEVVTLGIHLKQEREEIQRLRSILASLKTNHEADGKLLKKIEPPI